MKKNKRNLQIKKNTKLLAFYTLSWTLTMALATFGPLYLWQGNKMMTLAGMLLTTFCGILMILANIRYLNSLDELQRKIHLEGMSIALGVGIVGGLSYSLLDTTNLIEQDAEISIFVIIIALTYMVSVVIGQKRYA